MCVFEAGGFSAGAARSSLVGKLYFTITIAFGRVGNAALQVLRDESSTGPQLKMAMAFFTAIIAFMPKR